MLQNYEPRILRVSGPYGEKVHEFLVTCAGLAGVWTGVTGIFSGHGMSPTMTTSSGPGSTERLIINIYADFAGADCTAADVEDELRLITGVESVQSAEVSGTGLDKFFFPVMMTEGARAVVLPTSVIIRIEKFFEGMVGSQGKPALFEMGRQIGLSMVRDHVKPDKKRNIAARLGVLEDALRATGWGIFRFDTSSIEKGRLDVVVVEPIFADAQGVRESWYTYGIAAGVAEGSLGTKMVVGTTNYSKDTRMLKFKLVEQGRGLMDGAELKNLR